MDRRIIALLGIAVALLVAVGSVLAYVVLNKSGSNPFGGGAPTVGPTQTSVVGTSAGGKGCSITKTSTGYTFAWLHVANGHIVAGDNCIVNLKGFNWSQLEFGDAIGGGKTRISAEGVAWYNQTFQMNVWRIPVNAYWWNTNVDVPLAGMPYQSWIQQVIKWAEDNGDYVILTKGPQFHAPPCGGKIKFCPSQNYGKKTGDPQQTTTGQYIDPAVTMWTSIAKLYANDPAVLYDSWNEAHDIDAQTWQNSENALIAAIRAQNPRSLVFLGGPNYKGNINALVQNQIPDFTQPNLIYDFHVYDGYKGAYGGKNCNEPMSDVWRGWPNKADEQVGFSQQHNKAVAFSEWGGCNNFDQYNQDIISYARTHHIGLAYYDETNVATNTNGTYQLTDNGMKVQADYASY